LELFVNDEDDYISLNRTPGSHLDDILIKNQQQGKDLRKVGKNIVRLLYTEKGLPLNAVLIPCDLPYQPFKSIQCAIFGAMEVSQQANQFDNRIFPKVETSVDISEFSMINQKLIIAYIENMRKSQLIKQQKIMQSEQPIGDYQQRPYHQQRPYNQGQQYYQGQQYHRGQQHYQGQQRYQGQQQPYYQGKKQRYQSQEQSQEQGQEQEQEQDQGQRQHYVKHDRKEKINVSTSFKH